MSGPGFDLERTRERFEALVVAGDLDVLGRAVADLHPSGGGDFYPPFNQLLNPYEIIVHYLPHLCSNWTVISCNAHTTLGRMPGYQAFVQLFDITQEPLL